MSDAESGRSGVQSTSTPSSSSSSSDRFRFLRSLRDLLFGRRRRRGRRTSDDVLTVPRVKSSRSLNDELESRASIDSDGSHLASAASSSTPATGSARLE